jgi:hypothetical protein
MVSQAAEKAVEGGEHHRLHQGVGTWQDAPHSHQFAAWQHVDHAPGLGLGKHVAVGAHTKVGLGKPGAGHRRDVSVGRAQPGVVSTSLSIF